MGFDDFLNDVHVKAGAAPPGKAKKSKVVATSFDAFLNDVDVAAGTAARGPVTGFDHFLKRHVKTVRPAVPFARELLAHCTPQANL